MTRRLSIITTVVAITILFQACNGCNNSSKKVTLTVLGENSSNLQSMQALKGDYEQDNNIVINYKPNTFEDAYNKANQDFSTKAGQYDIVLQYNFSLSNFVRNKYVYTYDELSNSVSEQEKSFETDIFPNAWKEVGYYYKNPNNPSEGMTKIGYPFAANTMLLAYNKQFFEAKENKENYKIKYNKELAVPTTWNEYKQIADFFTNKQKGTYGVCIQGATGGWLYYEWCQYLQGFDGKVMNKELGWMSEESTPNTINTEPAKNATNYFMSLKPDNAGGFTNVDGNEQIKIMKDGKVAMCLIWSDYVRGLTYEGEKVDNRFGVAPVPGNKSMLAGGAFFINKQTKYPKEAFKYIVNLLQKDNQVDLMKRGLCSPLKSAYDAPEVQNIPYIPALKQSLERGVYALEAGPDADGISNTITTYIQQVWDGKLGIDEALANMQEEVIANRKQVFKDLKK